MPVIEREPQLKIKTIVPWAGGKRVLAPTIVQELEAHNTYYEPFCGGMAVLLAKRKCTYEVVNDLHGDLINLTMVIQDDHWGPKFYRQLRRTLVSEELHRLMVEVCDDEIVWSYTETAMSDYNLRRAVAFFIKSWLGRNGMAGTTSKDSFCIRYEAKGGTPGKRFTSAVDSIPQWRKRMRGVVILRRNGFSLIEKIPDKKGVAVYVDPPYLKKGIDYVYDFRTEDHVKLAKLLNQFKQARIVVSYYDDPLLDVYYPNWTKTIIDVSKNLSVQGKKGLKGARASEVLLVNK